MRDEHEKLRALYARQEAIRRRIEQTSWTPDAADLHVQGDHCAESILQLSRQMKCEGLVPT